SLHGSQTGVGMVARLNLGLALCLSSRYEEARGHIGAVRGQREPTGRPMYRVPVVAGVLTCAARLDESHAVDALYALPTPEPHETNPRDLDTATMLELAGELSEQSGQVEHARLAYQLALDHHQRLGAADGAERLAARLRALQV